MEQGFLAIFTVRYKKTEALCLSCTPPQGAEKTVVQYRARFEKLIAYVDVTCDLDDVVDAYIPRLKTILVGGADLLWSTCNT